VNDQLSLHENRCILLVEDVLSTPLQMLDLYTQTA